MAITLDLKNSQFGVPFAGAYFRIASASVVRRRNPDARHMVTIDVAGYATQPQDEDTKDVDFRRYCANLADVESQPGATFLAKCYLWVMSQDDMGTAIAS